MEHTTRLPIVVGVDGSPSALDAVRWAAVEAARRDLPVRLVHFYEPPVGLEGGIVDAEVMRGALREKGTRALSEARAVVTEVAAAPEIVLGSASVVPELVKESKRASLLVLGTRGLGGFTGLVVGSTAVPLAGRAHCPLVVVRGAGDEPPPVAGPVVVGVDAREHSEAAVAFAFAEAALHGADLVAVHAWSDPFADAVLLGHPTPPEFEPAQRQAYEALAGRLAGWHEKYPDVRVTREVVRDHPSRALLRYAAGARLVVVGTRGRGGFRGLVLGSTGQHVLHHAPCPVAIVRTGTDD